MACPRRHGSHRRLAIEETAKRYLADMTRPGPNASMSGNAWTGVTNNTGPLPCRNESCRNEARTAGEDPSEISLCRRDAGHWW